MTRRRLLLLSSSVVHGTAYLEYAVPDIRGFLGSLVSRVLFVPYALRDWDGYCAKVRSAFEAIGYALASIHTAESPARSVDTAEAVFVGGGNTFRLLEALYRFELIEPLRRRVEAGMPYLGASAGSNVACPTIRTTNDMPIVEPPSLRALELIPFQINPHYVDPDPVSTHMGETREERLLQYLEENDRPVVALREGALLRVEGDRVTLAGLKGARIFRRARPPVEARPGDPLEDLLAE